MITLRTERLLLRDWKDPERANSSSLSVVQSVPK